MMKMVVVLMMMCLMPPVCCQYPSGIRDEEPVLSSMLSACLTSVSEGEGQIKGGRRGE